MHRDDVSGRRALLVKALGIGALAVVTGCGGGKVEDMKSEIPPPEMLPENIAKDSMNASRDAMKINPKTNRATN
jgi:uncharacterized membrane protein YeiH